MAFTGLHVVCANAGGIGFAKDTPDILNGVQWSESPASNVASTNAAAFNPTKGQPVFHIIAAADSWVSIGPSPDPAVNPRILAQAGVPLDIFVSQGDKLRWIAA